jgi:hypothetical protein
MPKLTDITTWSKRLGRTKLRTFMDAEGHFWLEQNAAKPSKLGKFARSGHAVAWEFASAGGGYTGRMLIDGEIYTPAEATKKFFPRATAKTAQKRT